MRSGERVRGSLESGKKGSTEAGGGESKGEKQNTTHPMGKQKGGAP